MIALVVAMTENGVIGKQGQMPWHIPGEQAYFKRLTVGHRVVMGRKTYESIGHALPNRINYVLTRNPGYSAPDCHLIGSIEPILQVASEAKVFVIGGSAVFQMFLDKADRFYQTLIETSIEGDTFFPEWDPRQWVLESSREGPSTVLPHRFNVYVRPETPK
jgi:dihydrofolate reductase